MIGILLDLIGQIGALVAVFGAVLGVLVALELLRVGIDEWRAESREQRACERIATQQALGAQRRIVGEQIAERRG